MDPKESREERRERRKVGTLTIEDIPKTVPSLEMAVSNDVALLASQAATLLGYNVMTKEVTLGRLKEILAKLEIEILDEKTVSHYKEQVLGRTISHPDVEEEEDDEEYGWTQTPIHKYSEQIPEFVLRKAVQIKAALPQAEFQVEHLEEIKKDPDPFLIVSFLDERYYIEVWAEPGFEFLTKQGTKVRKARR